MAPVMLATILLILMLQLQSFSLMTMVFLTLPLGLIGVVVALLPFDAPLGFVATVLTIFFVPALYAAWFRIVRGAATENDRVAQTPVLAS